METCGGKPQDNGASPFNSSNVGVAGSSPAGVTNLWGCFGFDCILVGRKTCRR